MRQLNRLSIPVIAFIVLSSTVVPAAQAVELKFLPTGAKFEFKSSEKTFLRKLTGGGIECLSVSGTGEAISERLGLLDFLFLDCLDTLLGTKCTGLNDGTTGSILLHAEYHLRHLLEHPEDVDLVILVLGDGTSGSTAAHFTCLGVLQTVTGCVASDDLSKDDKTLWVAGQLVTLFLVRFLAKSSTELGDALNTSIGTDNSLGMESCTLLAKQEAGTAVSASQEGTGTVENCKSGGGACTFLIDLSGTL